MEWIGIALIVATGVIIVAGVVAVIGLIIYSLLNPATYVSEFSVTKTHLCNSNNCSFDIKFNIENHYPGDSQVVFEVLKDGMLQPPFIMEPHVSTYEASHTGDDANLFSGPGHYQFNLYVTGKVGGRIGTNRTETATQDIVIMKNDEENTLDYLVQRNISLIPADDRREIADTKNISSGDWIGHIQNDLSGPDTSPKGNADFHLSCKYTRITAITLVSITSSEVEDELAEYLKRNSEEFFIAEDDHRFNHPEQLNVLINWDNSRLAIDGMQVGETKVLDNPIILETDVTISTVYQSGTAPFFPSRQFSWYLAIHLECFE